MSVRERQLSYRGRIDHCRRIFRIRLLESPLRIPGLSSPYRCGTARAAQLRRAFIRKLADVFDGFDVFTHGDSPVDRQTDVTLIDPTVRAWDGRPDRGLPRA